MNQIQQISLKIQLGIEPGKALSTNALRTLRARHNAEKEARGRATRERRGYSSKRVEH